MKTETKNAMQVFEYLTGIRPEFLILGRGSMKGYAQVTISMNNEKVKFLKDYFYAVDETTHTYPYRKLGNLEIDYLHSTFPDRNGRMLLAVDVKLNKLIKTV